MRGLGSCGRHRTRSRRAHPDPEMEFTTQILFFTGPAHPRDVVWNPWCKIPRLRSRPRNASIPGSRRQRIPPKPATLFDTVPQAQLALHYNFAKFLHI